MMFGKKHLKNSTETPVCQRVKTFFERYFHVKCDATKKAAPPESRGTAVNRQVLRGRYAFTVSAMTPQMRSMSSAFRYGCIGSAKMSAAQASATGMSPFL